MVQKELRQIPLKATKPHLQGARLMLKRGTTKQPVVATFQFKVIGRKDATHAHTHTQDLLKTYFCFIFLEIGFFFFFSSPYKSK